MPLQHSALWRIFHQRGGGWVAGEGEGKGREGHHSRRMQVSSILQQCQEDDLLLVEVDTQHHGSHHRIVLEEQPFWNQYEKDPILCWLPFGNSLKIRVLWKQENQSVCSLSAWLGNLSIPIWLLLWGSCLVCLFWWWAPIVRSHNISAWLSSCRWDQKLRYQPRICTQDVLLQRIVRSILVLLGLMLPFVHEISFWLLFLLPFPQAAIQRSNMSDHQLPLELQLLCCRSSIEVQWPLYTRHSDQIAFVLLFSIFSHWKAKWSSSCILLCLRCHCPMHIICQNVEIWIVQGLFGVSTLCTIFIAVLTVFITRIIRKYWYIGWVFQEVPGWNLRMRVYSLTRSGPSPFLFSGGWLLLLFFKGIGISWGSGGEGRGGNRSRDARSCPTLSLSQQMMELEAILVVGQAVLAV